MARAHWGALVMLVAGTAALGPVLPACSRTANITGVYTALDGEGERRRTLFYTDTKEIHCVVEYGISRPGTTMEVLVRQLQSRGPDKVVQAQNRVLVAVENAPGRSGGGGGIQRQSVVFQALGADGEANGELPIPSGYYQCEAYLDGELGGTAAFAVDFAPCPAGQILPNTLCGGYYELDRVCKRYGSTAADQPTCRCAGDLLWECGE